MRLKIEGDIFDVDPIWDPVLVHGTTVSVHVHRTRGRHGRIVFYAIDLFMPKTGYHGIDRERAEELYFYFTEKRRNVLLYENLKQRGVI
jgi:hypothetical protein